MTAQLGHGSARVPPKDYYTHNLQVKQRQWLGASGFHPRPISVTVGHRGGGVGGIVPKDRPQWFSPQALHRDEACTQTPTPVARKRAGVFKPRPASYLTFLFYRRCVKCRSPTCQRITPLPGTAVAHPAGCLPAPHYPPGVVHAADASPPGPPPPPPLWLRRAPAPCNRRRGGGGVGRVGRSQRHAMQHTRDTGDPPPKPRAHRCSRHRWYEPCSDAPICIAGHHTVKV